MSELEFSVQHRVVVVGSLPSRRIHALEYAGYKVVEALDLEEATKALSDEAVDATILIVKKENTEDTIEFAGRIRDATGNACVFASSDGSDESTFRLWEAGMDGLVTPEMLNEALIRAVATAFCNMTAVPESAE